mmetsp:Transcript_35302/g.105457  ORF Transcript_35302/g.105457 Transcript_35302/m.105457 type:complete len:279 (+) Transcript_35302:297-1133(+)
MAGVRGGGGGRNGVRGHGGGRLAGPSGVRYGVGLGLGAGGRYGTSVGSQPLYGLMPVEEPRGGAVRGAWDGANDGPSSGHVGQSGVKEGSTLSMSSACGGGGHVHWTIRDNHLTAPHAVIVVIVVVVAVAVAVPQLDEAVIPDGIRGPQRAAAATDIHNTLPLLDVAVVVLGQRHGQPPLSRSLSLPVGPPGQPFSPLPLPGLLPRRLPPDQCVLHRLVVEQARLAQGRTGGVEEGAAGARPLLLVAAVVVQMQGVVVLLHGQRVLFVIVIVVFVRAV